MAINVPLLVIFWPGSAMNATVWWCLAASGAAQGVYYTALRRAYVAGDLSFVYPLARATPTVMLLMAESVLGVPHGWSGVLAVGLVVVGSAILPLGQGEVSYMRRFLTPAALWAGVTALGIFGYSLFDKVAIDGLSAAGMKGPIWYMAAEFTASMIAVWIIEYRPGGDSGWSAAKKRWPLIVLIGVMVECTYLLVLFAMQENKVSYVVACRQFSIVLGAALGVVWLKEREAVLGRVIGSLTITGGMVLAALSK
jgi:uncharacterized membrane protein